MTAKETYCVIVNHDRSVEKGIESGHYDWVDPNITSSNFPSHQKGTEEVDIRLVHFDRRMSTNEILVELDQMGFKPADHQHALAFGEKYPDVQRKFPIAFLGSSWRSPGGRRRCVFLSGGAAGRGLGLGWLGLGLGGSWCFAVLRK